MPPVRLATAAAAYTLFVIYGSLVPLDFHPHPMSQAWHAFQSIRYLELGIASRADWIANILLYIPLAFLLTGHLTANANSRMWTLLGACAAVLSCIALAFGVEFTQIFFPPRTVSQNDLIAETIGSVVGAAIWLSFGSGLLSLWREFWHGGPTAGRALTFLYLLVYLALSLFPYDFVVSPVELREKLSGSAHAGFVLAPACGNALQCSVKLLAEILAAAPLGILLGIAGRQAARKTTFGRAFLYGVVLGAVIEGLQFLLASGVSQGTSILTRGFGAVLGLALPRVFRWEWLTQRRRTIRAVVGLAFPLYVGVLLAMNGILAHQWDTSWNVWEKLRRTNFLPFYYHYYTTETMALLSALVTAASYAPIGLGIWLVNRGTKARRIQGAAALAAGLAAFCVETLKLFVHGKKPDPTNLLIAAFSGWLVCLIFNHLERVRAAVDTKLARTISPTALTTSPSLRGIWVFGLGGLATLALGGWLIASPPRERLVDESALARLPLAEDLPAARLPVFHEAHPRLPHPTAEEINLLGEYNPGFLERRKQSAESGSGDLEASVLTEFVQPGSQDLGVLHERLMSLKFGSLGNEQVKPLALAYDWLYPHWSPEQRAQLRIKLAEGCDYVIRIIRAERLSPYNMYLYDSPLQALAACAIALYRDDPRGEPVMAFTYDLWKNRVLPVWRQVMGKSGGWHEGGEYVGNGVGQAVYQVPEMWREVTDEDLFASEPGLRGFLDFLIYRTRPDKTYFRWGDAAYFDRMAPDGLPLALRYRNAAAYTLLRPPQELAPTSWPWGPLSDSSLIDRTALSRLPTSRLFDGIGLIVARSDWSPDATYVTFKAGDNYWSHSHLDQGAFTIYKGGALAIDSGLYGPKYGADHHMNYTYQTIAHNAVTVTDPDDTVPAPGKKEPRRVANDGGQRRVGSGWGVEAAPLDRFEWEAKRETYHTGSIDQFLDQEGLTVAVADITPAYTNRLSGTGTFSDRSRRVEHAWRVFGYDRATDVVIVYDDVRATRASFRKRWLLHTLQAPVVDADGFVVTVPALAFEGRGGGRLEGRVLLPEHRTINAIGGRGLEFLVDDRNVDEGGKIWEIVRERGPLGPEPGSWRIEVSPEQDAEDDQFLVVLLPSKFGDLPSPVVRKLRDANRVGCEVTSAARTSRWWFEPGRQGVTVDLVAGAETRSFQLLSPTSAPVVAHREPWSNRLRRWFHALQ